MKRTVWITLFTAFAFGLALVALMAAPRPVRAQSGDACYAVADNGAEFGNEDALVTLDRVTGVTTLIGRTGTNTVEAITFAPGGGNLYAANGSRLGILSLTSGAFTQLASPFGTGDGAAGSVTFSDVDGLAYDVGSDTLYGTHRRSGTAPDVLIQIDRTTGAHIPGAFSGDDYAVIDGPGLLGDIDDLAVDPLTGVMYAASNIGGDGGLLVTVDKETGAATVVGEFGVDDIEGLSYFNDGQLYGSTGKDGRDPSTRNQLFRINESTGQATFVAAFSDFRDYEALSCLTEPTSITLAGLNATGAPVLSIWLVVPLLALLAATFVILRRRQVTEIG